MDLPTQTQEQVTQATAQGFVAVANALRKWQSPGEDRLSPEQSAHFLIRLLFCLFAEDIRLLPYGVFGDTVKATLTETNSRTACASCSPPCATAGGMALHIARFDGGCSTTAPCRELSSDVRNALRQACNKDWSNIDPSIFGTLFERIFDVSKRAQLGAHYTSKDDILLVIEPVLMQPLRELWQEVRLKADGLVRAAKRTQAAALLGGFASRSPPPASSTRPAAAATSSISPCANCWTYRRK